MKNTTEHLTADTITDEQIEALRNEAIEVDDDEQVDLCRLALGRRTVRAWNLIPYGARGRCAEAINAARAMDDGAATDDSAFETARAGWTE